ncbi:hypothetical protein [Muriicola sp. Z0-33]|uniref:hypothetical protein n=1 Tax=Muriicola sp. Z0-33 TaxID=2816957 RepID=UPI002238BD0D|nr:hypothetical protein [Muriicola sp. Z0-33]MCW5516165.1 hypothetical protein [Muriicola sp. Z0-33]
MLSEDEQWDTVFAKGKFLDIYTNGNIKFVLYAIEQFYFEVKWDIEKDEIIGTVAFKYGQALAT